MNVVDGGSGTSQDTLLAQRQSGWSSQHSFGFCVQSVSRGPWCAPAGSQFIDTRAACIMRITGPPGSASDAAWYGPSDTSVGV